jgi:hypothetical protein
LRLEEDPTSRYNAGAPCPVLQLPLLLYLF